jgi:hypothetical protein
MGLVCVEDGLLEFGKRFGHVGAQTLEIRQFVSRNQTEEQLPGVAEQSDVEQVAGRQGTDWMQFLKAAPLI